MHVVLGAVLDVLATALGQLGGAGRRLSDATLWRGPDLSRWTIASAVAAFVPLVPLTVAVGRFAVAAWRLAEDPMFWFIGLLVGIPAAVMAVAVLVLATTAAMWTAAALLGGRLHARLYGAVYGISGVLIGAFFVMGGVTHHGLAMAGTSAVFLALLSRR